MPSQNTAAAIIGFDNRRAQKAPLREPKSLLERVYTEGSLVLRADDRPARTVAAMLGRLGFLILDEIGPEGAVTRVTPAQMGLASKNPWRVSKPDLSQLGQDGDPDTGLA